MEIYQRNIIEERLRAAEYDKNFAEEDIRFAEEKIKQYEKELSEK